MQNEKSGTRGKNSMAMGRGKRWKCFMLLYGICYLVKEKESLLHPPVEMIYCFTMLNHRWGSIT